MTKLKTIAFPVVSQIEEKKSRFIACLFPIKDEEEALFLLEKTKSDYPGARHYVYAYIIQEKGSSFSRIRYSDDGEPSKTAGLPVLELLQHSGLSCVLAVVVRYFGGILLGTGGLVRSYTQSVQKALESAEMLTVLSCVDISFCVPYSFYGPLTQTIALSDAKLLTSTFEEKVSVLLRCPEESAEVLKTQLSSLLKGDIEFTTSEIKEVAF